MKRRIELFRTLGQYSAKLPEELIAAWGRIEFHLLVCDLVNGRRLDIPELPGLLLDELKLVEQEHRESFPKFAGCYANLQPAQLAGNASFEVLHACFRHIAEKISIVWGGESFMPYVAGLLNAGERINRQGFPPEIAAAL